MVALLQRQLLPRIRRSAFRLSGASVAISSRLTENIQGLRLLHSLGQLRARGGRLRGRAGGAGARAPPPEPPHGRCSRPSSGLLPLLAMAAIALVSVVVFGARGSGVLPSLVTFVLALQRLNTVLSRAGQAFTSLSANAANLERLNRFLLPDGKQFRRLGGLPFAGLRRGMRFERGGPALRARAALGAARHRSGDSPGPHRGPGGRQRRGQELDRRSAGRPL